VCCGVLRCGAMSHSELSCTLGSENVGCGLALWLRRTFVVVVLGLGVEEKLAVVYPPLAF